ncbi:MAG: hypothetical protein IMW86_03170 [Hydrogenibacillus sp.]|nr:hypothetical protein [Hydrogenibacillus sp.]
MLIVEQNARAVFRLAHRAYVMETGSIALEGKTGDLMSDPAVQRFYLGGEATAHHEV